jgi:hypothetical protein
MHPRKAWFCRFGHGAVILLAAICAGQSTSPTQLPNGRLLATVPGRPRPTNSLPSAAAVSPDQRYVALLNAGYGTYDSEERQSIAIFDRQSNQLTDFPDERLGQKAKQSYFLGLAFSRDGRQLYASMSSLTDPLGKGKEVPETESPFTVLTRGKSLLRVSCPCHHGVLFRRENCAVGICRTSLTRRG